MDKIDILETISEGEQVYWVLTSRGGYVVGARPEGDRLDRDTVLAKANSLAEAKTWFRKAYGLEV